MNSKSYRCCAVPLCKNTTKKNPDKLFIFVPYKLKAQWLKLARRDPKGVSKISTLYFCEDHFDLPNDMENYMQYHVMGLVSQIRMKPGCLPTKFGCQPDRKLRASEKPERPYVAKKRRMMIIEECLKQYEEKCNKSGRRKQILTERREGETTDITAPIENHEPQQNLEECTMVMIDQPADSSTNTQEGYCLMYPVVELTCPEGMQPDTNDDVVDIKQENLLEEPQHEWKIEIEEHSVQERPSSPDIPPEVSVPDTRENCGLNEQVSLGVEETLTEKEQEKLNKKLYEIIVNVYCFLDKEYRLLKGQCCQTCDLSPLAGITRRTAAAVGVSEETVAEALGVKKTDSISLDHSYPLWHTAQCSTGSTERDSRITPEQRLDDQSDTEIVQVPKRKKTRRLSAERVQTQPVGDPEGAQPPFHHTNNLLKRRKKTKYVADDTYNSPSHQVPTNLSDATETEFKTEPFDANWQNMPEQDPLNTVSKAVVHYEAPDGTRTVLPADSDESQHTEETDPLDTESSAFLRLKPSTTSGVDVKIEPNDDMELCADDTVCDVTPLDVKCELPEV